MDHSDELPFKRETTTIWDFPIRGAWATHKPDYRGNFAPQIPRNLILAYSMEGDIVLDPMVGSGTTLIEARLLNRDGIGFDINEPAVSITKERLSFEVANPSKQSVYVGDVRCIPTIESDSIDLIVTHPPYLDLVTYSDGKNPNDLSSISDIPKFFDELEIGIREMYRTLKPGKMCAILIGDTRRAQHYISLSYFLLHRALASGFVLKEEIIKTQHNTRFERKWAPQALKYNFFLIMHEHLFVFRKPLDGENLTRIRYSSLQGYERLEE
jgi:DNA modification methylase